MTRHLIVNADDLGASQGVNRGILEAHERGIVTSASLMVRRPAAGEAAAAARGLTSLSLGLHLDLAEWAYRDGRWEPLYERADSDDAAGLEAEVAGQIDAFRRLVDRNPTHLDSHQHVHLSPPLRATVAGAGERLGVPVRRLTPGVAYEGSFYGQSTHGEPTPDSITADALIAILRRLPAGYTELCCHPGYAEGLESSYRGERERELAALCDPRVAAELDAQDIELVGFRDLRRSA